MRSLHHRVAKIEKRCGESREVARIVGIFRRATDEELRRLLKNGWLARMAEQLSVHEIEVLLAELRALQTAVF